MKIFRITLRAKELANTKNKKFVVHPIFDNFNFQFGIVCYDNFIESLGKEIVHCKKTKNKNK